MPEGSAVNKYDIRWEFNFTPRFPSFRAALDSSITNYTISGLRDYGDVSLLVTLTAFNEVGNTTSPVLSVSANFATQHDGTCSRGSNEVLIAGGVTGGCVVIGLLIGLILGLIFCCYKHKQLADGKSSNCCPSRGKSQGVVSTTNDSSIIETLANE